MRPDKITKSEAAFASDKEVKRNAGYTDIKRDAPVKDISTSLYDVDYAIKWHLESFESSRPNVYTQSIRVKTS